MELTARAHRELGQFSDCDALPQRPADADAVVNEEGGFRASR